MMRRLRHIICQLLLLSIAWTQAFSQPLLDDQIREVLTERDAPIAVHEDKLAKESTLSPFGSNLFKGTFFSAEREDGLNPDYIIQPGDRITLRIWGATSINEITVVDAQGNIFIPEVGPIHVEGVKNAQLNQQIKSAVEKVFTQNINVYTNLQATTPVIVFVTGFVNRPGGYAGVASDSLLYFLERAGGVDPQRGSYRDVRVMRDGKQVADADLYAFIIKGTLPRLQFADGDTIVVGRRGASITAEGAARNSFSFEIPDKDIIGKDLINLARPWVNASYATILGTRNNQPFSTYLPTKELEDITLFDGDQVIFEVDQVHGTMLIRVEGSHTGQSRFAVPRNTRLREMLDYIKVDNKLADLDAISLRRESLKLRQKKAIEESLQRLETAILGRNAITPEGAEIQSREAELISSFVQRARQVEPRGILVVAENDQIADVLLQPNDIITIPDKTNIVQVSGEVMVPQALVYEPNYTLKNYIDKVGGYTEYADEEKHLIMRRSGEVIPVFKANTTMHIRPGDEIIPLPEVPGTSVEILRLVTDTVFKIASAAAIFVRF